MTTPPPRGGGTVMTLGGGGLQGGCKVPVPVPEGGFVWHLLPSLASHLPKRVMRLAAAEVHGPVWKQPPPPPVLPPAPPPPPSPFAQARARGGRARGSAPTSVRDSGQRNECSRDRSTQEYIKMVLLNASRRCDPPGERVHRLYWRLCAFFFSGKLCLCSKRHFSPQDKWQKCKKQCPAIGPICGVSVIWPFRSADLLGPLGF